MRGGPHGILQLSRKDSLRDSYAIEDKQKQRQKGQPATGANSYKWDSTAAAAGEPQAQTTRIPHGQGSRAAHGDRTQAWALWAPKRDHDPHCVSAWAASIGGVRAEWDMVDLPRGLMHVRRSKNGTPSVQPLGGIELRALRKLKREEIDSRFVFMTERAAPITTEAVGKQPRGRNGQPFRTDAL
jgi:hypothetical protein